MASSLSTPHGHPHSWGTVGEGPRKKFGYVSFGAFDEDIERFVGAATARSELTASIRRPE